MNKYLWSDWWNFAAWIGSQVIFCKPNSLVNMTNDGMIKIPSTLSGNSFSEGNILWTTLIFYDLKIHRNSYFCHPSKYFEIWNDNEVTIEISFVRGICIIFLIELYKNIFHIFYSTQMYWSYNQNIFVVV